MDLNAADDVLLQDDKGLTIAQHVLRCKKEFETHRHFTEVTYDPTIMEDQMARFTLWASNMDVFGPPNVSLDDRLRYNPTAVDIIHRLLDVLLNTLIFLTPCEKSARTPTTKKRRTSESGRANVTKIFDYSSETDSEGDMGERNVSLITYTIAGTVSRLSRLSRAALQSARADTIAAYQVDEKTNNAIQELRLHTEDYIHSRFPHAPKTLCSALVEASALRFRHLCYEREYEEYTPFRGKCHQLTFILEYQKTICLDDHLLRHLEPFVCIVDHCTDSGVLEPCTLIFEASSAWLSHMKDTHQNVWECRAPSHQPIIFQKEAEFQEHSRTEHHVPEAYVGTLSGAARRPGLHKITECPFRDDFAAPKDSKSDTVFSSKALRRHVATHMKDISLLALHKLASFDADISEDKDPRPAVKG
ncbi:hypothetical protein MY3296_005246 [Beauveria thailandica]